MTVYILGAGASWDTDAYGSSGRGLSGTLARDHRPPLMSNFFPIWGLPDRVAKMLKPLEITAERLVQGEPRGANLESVLSLVDLARRLLGERLNRWDPQAPVSDEVRDACAAMPSDGLFPEGAQVAVEDIVRGAVDDARAQAKSAAANMDVALGGAYVASVLARTEFIETIERAYAPTEPYRYGGDRRCGNYERLVERLDDGDVVITFNYDFLLDRVLEEVGGLLYRSQPLPTTYDLGGRAVKYLKLHGSVLWYVEYVGGEKARRSAGESSVGTVRFEEFKHRLLEVRRGADWLPPEIHDWQNVRTSGSFEELRACEGDTSPENRSTRIEKLIVPPTAVKTWRPEIKALWDHAGSALGACEEIFVIGYSFPDTDFHVREMTKAREGGYGGVPVNVVTREGNEADLTALEQRVREAFPGAKVRVQSNDGFGKWVKTKVGSRSD